MKRRRKKREIEKKREIDEKRENEKKNEIMESKRRRAIERKGTFPSRRRFKVATKRSISRASGWSKL